MPSAPCGARASACSIELLLAVANILVCAVELGEERLAVLLDGGAGGAESLPQLVRLALRQARGVVLVRLPLGEQGVECGAGLLPLRLGRVFGGEALGLFDDGGALGEGGGDGGLGLGALLLGELADGAAEGSEALGERGEVADGVGVVDRAAQVGDGLRDVGGGSAAAWRAARAASPVRRGRRTCARSKRAPPPGCASGYCPTARSPSASRT